MHEPRARHDLLDKGRLTQCDDHATQLVGSRWHEQFLQGVRVHDRMHQRSAALGDLGAAWRALSAGSHHEHTRPPAVPGGMARVGHLSTREHPVQIAFTAERLAHRRLEGRLLGTAIGGMTLRLHTPPRRLLHLWRLAIESHQQRLGYNPADRVRPHSPHKLSPKPQGWRRPPLLDTATRFGSVPTLDTARSTAAAIAISTAVGTAVGAVVGYYTLPSVQHTGNALHGRT